MATQLSRRHLPYRFPIVGRRRSPDTRHHHCPYIRSPGRANLRRDRRRQHGYRPPGKITKNRRLHPAQQTTLGRRGDHGTRIRANRLRKNMGRRSIRRRPRRLRLAAPAPRGFHRPVWQVLRLIRPRSLVPGATNHLRSNGSAPRLRQSLRAEESRHHQDLRIHDLRRFPLRDVLGHRHLRHRPRRPRPRYLSPDL